MVELTSSIAETLAEAPEVLTATPLWLKLYIAANKKNSKNNRHPLWKDWKFGFCKHNKEFKGLINWFMNLTVR